MVKTLKRWQKNRKGAQQYGGKVNIFRGSSLQRGHGLGGLLKTLFRVAVPVIRRAAPIVKRVTAKVGKAASRKALGVGKKVLKDVATKNSTLKDSLKKHAQEAALNAAMDAINKSVVKKKARTLKRQSKGKHCIKQKTKAPRL